MKTFLLLVSLAAAVSASAAVATKWTAQLDRSAYDQAVNIGTDANGNIYLAFNTSGTNGFTNAPDKPFGWVVAKYTVRGSKVWEVSSPDDFDIVLRSMVVDLSGEVSIVGSTYTDSAEYLYAARVGTAGEIIWQHHHVGSGVPPLSAGNVIATAGDITWVAGTVYTNDIGFLYPVAGLLVALNPQGQPTKQIVDALPDLFETAGFASLSLDRTGALLLRQPGYPTNIGWCAYVVKYSPAGERQWFHKTDIIDLSAFGKYPLSGPVADGAGNVFITGPVLQGDFRAEVIKLASTGAPLWHALYSPGFGGGADVADLLVDPTGNVVVTGAAGTAYIYDDFYVRDIFTIKYRADGTFRWLARGTAPPTPIMGRAVAMDGLGNTYVAGEGNTAINEPRYSLGETMKFNRLGQRQWITSMQPGPGPGKIAGLLLSRRGDIIIGGSDEVNYGRPVDAYLVAYREKSDLASPHLLGPVKVLRHESEVILSVSVAGRGPLHYEWFRNGVSAIPQSSNSGGDAIANERLPGRSLTIADETAAPGEYYVEISNSYGSVVSEVVRLSLPSLNAVIDGVAPPAAPVLGLRKSIR